jgi:hypothetical protein
MPRKPTGRPPGRPPGSGLFTTPKRVTVWMDGSLYAQLEAYAAGRHFHQGDPQLSSCVRELLEHALACPQKHQTRRQTGHTSHTSQITREGEHHG